MKREVNVLIRIEQKYLVIDLDPNLKFHIEYFMKIFSFRKFNNNNHHLLRAAREPRSNYIIRMF